jgi:exonuclease SbcD
MPIKILATADLHLGKTSADVLGERASTKSTWAALVSLAIENNIDVLVLCGDIVDRNNRYFEAVGPLQAGIDRLREQGITVYLVSGNHDFDVLPQVVRKYNDDGVKLIGKNGVWEIVSFSKDGQTIQFAGWSFPSQYIKDSPLLDWKFGGIDPNFPVIGLLHGDIEGKDSKYAPFSLDELKRTPVNLWILGHIHKPFEYSAQKPLVWYTGSPQAMSAKEPGLHGPLLFTVDGDHFSVKQVGLSPVRYETLEIDINGADDEEQIREKILTAIEKDASTRKEQLTNVSFLVYQLEITGQHARIREVEHWARLATDIRLPIEGDLEASVRKVDCYLRPVLDDLKDLSGQSSPAGILAETILAIGEGRSTIFLEKLIQQWRQRTTALNEAGVYLPLSDEERLIDIQDSDAKVYLQRECNRLLGELKSQSR